MRCLLGLDGGNACQPSWGGPAACAKWAGSDWASVPSGTPCRVVLFLSTLPFLPALQVDKTVLYFPKPLSAIYGNQMQWSYMGGFLT